MASLPDGDPAPPDGLLPASARDNAGADFGVYVHIPFCRVRCGYCDFNTYTATDMPGVAQAEYGSIAEKEIVFAQHVLDTSGLPARPVNTLFFGGGTPTLLPPGHLASLIRRIRETWGIAPGAEITVEANPDTVDEDSLRELRDAGVTRMSFGVQSFVPRVLSLLDRTHNPEAVPQVVDAARRVGLSVSIDLIYGSPGETEDEWARTLRDAIALEPDHISAYSLIVEPGTALARRVERGELAGIDEDTQATFYEMADEAFSAAGYEWYEVSNWSRGVEHRSRHNLSYWTNTDWWGVGPGAHSHVGGVRWWNVKHPKAYADRLEQGLSPALAREILSGEEKYTEMVMLRLRIRDGLPISSLHPGHQEAVAWAIAGEFVDAHAALGGTLVLTRKGRLVADGVARQLLGS
ncbi:MAG: radical SAM family heme chaperone HemW [Pontimonas sp.]